MDKPRLPDAFYICGWRSDRLTGVPTEVLLRGPYRTEHDAREERELLVRKGELKPEAHIKFQRFYD